MPSGNNEESKHTKDILADELMKVGLGDMSLRARSGYYHDFLSPLATPELQLMGDLAQAAYRMTAKKNREAVMALRRRVMNGDFDASKEESDAWAQTDEYKEAMRRLAKGE